MRLSAVIQAVVSLSYLAGCQGFCLFSAVPLNNVESFSARVASDDPSHQGSHYHACWKEKLCQLLEFRDAHGHTRVPKRYPENPALGNWVNKQRQIHRKHLAGEKPCSTTERRIQILNDIGFCWDPSPINAKCSWWKQLEEYRACASSPDELPAPVNRWVRQQRLAYQNYLDDKQDSKLDEEKIKALNEIDPGWWKSFRQCQWEARYNELVAYREEHGDCCVPINFENKRLAHWVSNNRKNYNLKMAGKCSKLTPDRIEELNAIGFVWNYWDYKVRNRAPGRR